MSPARAARRKPRTSAKPAQAVALPGSRPWWPIALIVVVGVVLYWNSLGNPFVFDDRSTIADNANIRSFSTAFQTSKGSALAGRPVVGLTFAANYAIGGLNVVGYRVINIGLHILGGLALFGLVRRTLELPSLSGQFQDSGNGIATATALLWTVHPLNSEVVDYLTQRTESMMALCFAFACYANARALLVPSRTAWEAAAIVVAAIGMLCKETMTVLPVLIVMFDRVFAFDSLAAAWRSRRGFYLALAGTWLVAALSVALSSRELSGGYASTHVSTWSYLLNQMPVVTHYLWLVVWPRDLVAYYGWSLPNTLANVWPFAALIIVLFIGSVALLMRRPAVGFLAMWFWITLGPTSSVLPIAAEVGADRRMYLPMMGVAALAVVAAYLVLDRFAGGRKTLTAVVVTVLLTTGLSARTIARNRDYASELALSQSTLDARPSGVAHDMVGLSLVAVGRRDEAIQHLRQAAVDYPPAHYGLGAQLFQAGQIDEAIRELQRFIQLEPRQYTTSVARTLLGRALIAQQRMPEAIEQLKLAVGASQPDPQAHALLAELLLDAQQFGDAIEHYRAYLGQFPSDAVATGNLGIALASANRPDDAIAVFRRAVQLAPNRAGGRENLARMLIERGQIDEAASEIRQALALSPASAGAHDLMGQVFVAQKKIEEARREFLEALRFDPNFAEAREHLRRIGG